MSSTQLNENAEGENSSNDVKVLLQSLLDDSSQLQNMYKAWNVTLKKLAREMDKEQRKLSKTKPKRKVTQKPQEVNNNMQSFMKKNCASLPDDYQHNGSYTRQVMMKAVSGYIKDKNLQNQDNKKEWKADNQLKGLFNLDKEWYTFMQINGLLSKVVVTK